MKALAEPSSHLVTGMVVLAFVIALPLFYHLWQDARAGAKLFPELVTRPASLLTVMVSGEVGNPGVYHLNPGTRIRRLLRMVEPRFPAGLIEARRLDLPLESGRHYQFSSRLEAGMRVLPLGIREKLVLSIPVDLNSASAEELDALPYVSKKAARLIVEYRRQHGPLQDLDELSGINGLGRKLVKSLKRYTSVGER